MANIKSAVKRAKQSEVKRLRNRSGKSAVLTARKKVL
ncbi:MAG: 30S ribosomal protein S20, partial [Kiritimatiellae bacterium]|nr:30S ribosomal protein S20 [Kiritimatiellia bacterium]